MQKKTWFCLTLDVIGLTALACAGTALVGANWFQDTVPESLLFNIFFGSFALAASCFLLGRSVEIWKAVASNPDPKRLRREAAIVAADGAPRTDDEFPRAA